VHCLAYSHDGRFLASGDKAGNVLLWRIKPELNEDTITNVLVDYAYPPPVFSSNGDLMATVTASNQVTIWNLSTWQPVQTFDGAKVPLAISPDNLTLTAAGPDFAFQLWDIPSGEIQDTARFVEPKYVFRASLSPDGKILAIGKSDGTVELWNPRTGQAMWRSQGHKGAVRELALSPHDRLMVTASRDFLAKLWDVKTGKELATLSGHTDGVFSAAFSPDGKLIATGAIDGTARLWDAATRKQLTVLTGHKEGVYYISFSGDGQTLATASGDRTVRLWNLATRREVARLDHGRDVVTVGFTPRGDALISSVLDGTIRRWSAPSFAELDALEREKLRPSK